MAGQADTIPLDTKPLSGIGPFLGDGVFQHSPLMGVVARWADNSSFGFRNYQPDSTFRILDLLGDSVRRHSAIMVDSDGMQPCFTHMATFALSLQRGSELPVLGRVKHGSVGDLGVAV